MRKTNLLVTGAALTALSFCCNAARADTASRTATGTVMPNTTAGAKLIGASKPPAAVKPPAAKPIMHAPVVKAKPKPTPRPATKPKPAAEAELWSPSLDAAMARSKQTHKPIMVDFFATWCGPCKILGLAYAQPQLARELRNWVPVQVDVDKYPAISGRYNIQSLPTIVFFNAAGQESGRQVGFSVDRPLHNNAELLAMVADQTVHSLRLYAPPARHAKGHKSHHARHSG